MTYPSDIYQPREVENLPGITFDEDNKKTLYAEDYQSITDEIVIIEETLGLHPEGPFDTVTQRLSALVSTINSKQDALGYTAENVANKSTSTSLGTSDTIYPSQKAVKTYVDNAIAAAKQALYPVGSIWTSTSVSTSPATVLGFGTWSSFGAGRVLVSKAPSGTFATAGSTGGSETHTLTTTEMPSHFHTSIDATNSGLPGFDGNIVTGGSSGSGASITQTGSAFRVTNGNAKTGSAGSGGAHNNLQPYIVVYMWQRTA